MAIITLPLAITIRAIIAEMANSGISAMAIDIINMAILGIQLKSLKN